MEEKPWWILRKQIRAQEEKNWKTFRGKMNYGMWGKQEGKHGDRSEEISDFQTQCGNDGICMSILDFLFRLRQW